VRAVSAILAVSLLLLSAALLPLWRRVRSRGVRLATVPPPPPPLPLILVIEDYEPIAYGLCVELTRLPADVKCAKTAAEARRLLEDTRFEAAVIDLSLPDGSGLDIACGIRRGLFACGASIPLVVVTGVPAKVEEIRIACGADLVLTKPFQAEDVRAEVIRLLRDPSKATN